ncbi:MAG TPA: type II toxin-antitoxin system antitoxin SocA domain-containing protein [Streptosporangiaceae bacterium]|nr:type II toxin-antitoxin system antitoxin SocA domain-containing protein [Streptosporangiaceae bacterium]
MGAPPYPAMTIARWFVAWAEAEEEELSNLKLQKLLYYAQGHYLARHGRPLFSEQMQAWSHGPVVPEVYQAFKGFGTGPLELPESDSFTWDDVDSATSEFLGMVWNTYGGYSAGRLRNMTHSEPPWRANWRGEGDRGALIGESDLRKYFGELAAAG